MAGSKQKRKKTSSPTLKKNKEKADVTDISSTTAVSNVPVNQVVRTVMIKKKQASWTDTIQKHIFWFLVTFIFYLALLHSLSFLFPQMFANAEQVALVRIPTGSHQNATRMIHELERVGLGARVDHLRTARELEAFFDPVELRRLQEDVSTTLDLKKFPPPYQWRIVRNMSGIESGIARPKNHDKNRPNFYIPINKYRYHTLEEIEHILRAFARKYPNLAGVERAATSQRSSIVWAMRISGASKKKKKRKGNRQTHPVGPELPHKASILFTGSLHGNDYIGQEMCLWLIEYICESYSRNPVIRRILDDNNIYVIPVLNPDARKIKQRYTHRGIDMDRAFHDRIAFGSNPVIPENLIETFTAWLQERNFMVSASFLGGGGGSKESEGLVIRYPWNSAPQEYKFPGRAERTLDDRGFRYLARKYVGKHPILNPSDKVLTNPHIGAVNGAEWFPRYGSLQDWIYEHIGTLHLDLVISKHLKPLPQHLLSHWYQNRDSTEEFLKSACTRGVRGTLTDSETGDSIESGEVVIFDINDNRHRLHPVRVNHREGGFFARFLVPSRYALRASAPDYHPTDEILFRIHDRNPIHVLNLQLRPKK